VADVTDSLAVDKDVEQLTGHPRYDKCQQREWKRAVLNSKHTALYNHTDNTCYNSKLMFSTASTEGQHSHLITWTIRKSSLRWWLVTWCSDNVLCQINEVTLVAQVSTFMGPQYEASWLGELSLLPYMEW